MSKWNNYFMNIAIETSKLSRDPNTKVGAVIVKNKRIKSTGYNGAPASFPDELVPTSSDSSLDLIYNKNTYMCHAELNAVLNYDGQISDLKDADVYVTVSPCSKCACMLAQIGVNKIIYKEKYHREDENIAAGYILSRCGINLYEFKNDI